MATKKWKRDDLIETFRGLGAADPEALASSQLDDGVPALHRFAFLKRLWDQVADWRTTKWIEQATAQSKSLGADDPQAAAGPALQRMLAAGVDPMDVIKVVWSAQAEMIYNVAFQLDDPEFAVAQLPQHGGMLEHDVTWGLYTATPNGKPKELIEGFHETWMTMVPAPQWADAARPGPNAES